MKKAAASLFIVIIIIAAIIVLYAGNPIFSQIYVNIKQPIEFNHKKHTGAVGLECDHCHRYYKTQANSGPPTIEICIECHETPITESKEEEKIRQYHKEGKDIPWQRIYYMPDHVFFSHRLHTQFAKINCETCHGDMKNQERPPAKPIVLQTMEFCIDCHKENQANIDCLACHK